MSQLEKVRFKLLYMEDFLEKYLLISKKEQYVNLYNWAESWTEERIGDWNASSELLSENRFWSYWKLSIYKLNLMFVQNMYSDNLGRPYLLVYSSKSKKARKEYDVDTINHLYEKFMSQMILDKSPSSPTGEESFHQYVKTISQSK